MERATLSIETSPKYRDLRLYRYNVLTIPCIVTQFQYVSIARIHPALCSVPSILPQSRARQPLVAFRQDF
ncbi:hypothetical protein PILCRDRAFT_818043 [Piloderma croceum F 1598]|uniref:Uncharacterized protein n=1 Tax=Piloderma croceum (strain F 1598) TaxID=765440 RepID=A0A0C3C4A7_PILCF|nr:hypothetical protein PILCRDRAFT_818043 [Piloderma croceum F 1598]